MRPLHERMPVVLPPDVWEAWLSPDTPAGELLPLLRPYPGPMTATRANPLVNKAGTEGPELLAA